jgi:hypothetical protein
MDQDVGANALWHTCIILSKLDEVSNKLKVVDNWGFYGLPTTSSSGYIRDLKIKAGLDVDFTGNHGKLRHEELRYLDLGVGLHGVTFELTEEKFLELQNKCRTMADSEKQAIDEIAEALKLQGKKPGTERIHIYEEHSDLIFRIERLKAKQEGRSSRLFPFELSPLPSANTCKVQALSLLNGILTSEQINRLTGINRAVSRFSGPMENIYLHSSGPMRCHTKRSGEKVYFRDMADSGVELHWSIPPQEVEMLSGDTLDLFKIDDGYSDEIKLIVRRLQKAEWLFRNVILDAKFDAQREELIAVIREAYQAFSIIKPKPKREQGMLAAMMRFISVPVDQVTIEIVKKCQHAKSLLLALYTAIDDNWSFEECDDVEALAAYLPEDKKVQLYEILGYHYELAVDDMDESLIRAM